MRGPMVSLNTATASVIAARYVTEHELGRGASGVVLRAWDLVEERDVALKLLANGPEDLEGLRREFDLAVHLRHPHIVEVRDFGAVEGEPVYISMQLLDAVPFDEACRSRTPQQVLALGHQVLSALEFLGRRGLVHGDLKPSNVLVDAAGVARVLDFGLAVTVGSSGTISGTPATMAPEVARGAERDQRSDLYSLGVMLYEAIAGRNPFLAETASDTLRRHLMVEAPLLHRVATGVDIATSELIARLLQKDPDVRHPSASHALRAFGALLGSGGVEVIGSGHVTVMEPPLIGRDAELQTVVEALRGAYRGGAVLKVEGIEGAGRSAFCQEIRIQAQLAGLPVVSVRCHSGQSDGRQALTALESLDRRPAALVVDDVQLATAGTLEALRRLVAGAEADKLVVVLSSHVGSDDPTLGEGTRISLEPLRDIGALLNAATGRDVDVPTLAGPIAHYASGLPGAALDLIRRLSAQGLLETTSATVRGHSLLLVEQALAATPDVPARRTLAERLDLLSTPVRRVFDSLVVTRTPSTTQLLSAVGGMDRRTVAASVNALLDADLAIMDAGGPGTLFALSPAVMPLLAEAIVRESMSPVGWRRMHRKAASHRLASGEGEQAEIVRLAENLVEAGLPDPAIFFGLRAAQVLESRGDAPAALALLERVEGVFPNESRNAAPRLRILTLRGRLQQKLGHYQEALGTIAEAIARSIQTNDEAVRFTLIRRRSEVLARLGRLDAAILDADRLASWTGELEPEDQLEAMLVVAEVRRLGGRLELAREALERALGLEDGAAPLLRARALRELATLDWQQGRLAEAREHAGESIDVSRDAGDEEGVADGSMAYGTALRMAGAHLEAIRAYEQASAVWVRLGRSAQAGKAHNNIAVCQYLLGQWEAAADHWQIAVRIAEQSGEVAEQLVLLNNLGYLYLERGLFPQAEGALTRALELAERTASVRLEIIVCGNLGELRMRQERFDESQAMLERSEWLARQTGSSGDAVESRRRMSELALARGDLATAARLVQGALAEASSLGLDTEVAQLERINAIVHARSGQPDEARAALTRATAIIGTSAENLDGAVLRLAHAEVAISEGRIADAVDGAQTALRTLTGLGVAWHVQLARDMAERAEAALQISHERVNGSGPSVVGRVLRELAGDTDPEHAARLILAHVLAVTTGERATLFMRPLPHLKGLRVSAARLRESTVEWSGRVDGYSRTVATRVLEHGETVCLQNVEDDATIAAAASVAAMRLRSLLCVPVRVDGEVGGLIYVDSRVMVGDAFANSLPAVTEIALAYGLALERFAMRARLQAEGEVLSIVAHELRTPLGLIMGFSELLGTEVDLNSLPEQVGELVRIVYTEGSRMRRMVSDMRDLGNVTAVAVHAVAVQDPNALIADVLRALEPAALEAGVKLAPAESGALPPVRVDTQRLRQVFVNLATNAMRYSSKGGTVTVSAIAEPPVDLVGELPMVRFTVQDQGPGLAPGDEVRIFEKFNRGAQPKGDGSGLGLSIARAIVHAHGGRIWVESEPGAGCRFSFTVPAAHSGEAADEAG